MEYKTRYPELNYTKVADEWRFVDSSTSAVIGPYYHSKAELLADPERYAISFGCDGTTGKKAPHLPKQPEQVAEMIELYGLDMIVQHIFEKYEWIREVMKRWHESTGILGIPNEDNYPYEFCILKFLFNESDDSVLADSFFRELIRITKPIKS